jgi:hypothetical protein
LKNSRNERIEESRSLKHFRKFKILRIIYIYIYIYIYKLNTINHQFNFFYFSSILENRKILYYHTDSCILFVENKQNLYVLNIKKNKLKGEESYKNEFN